MSSAVLCMYAHKFSTGSRPNPLEHTLVLNTKVKFSRGSSLPETTVVDRFSCGLQPLHTFTKGSTMKQGSLFADNSMNRWAFHLSLRTTSLKGGRLRYPQLLVREALGHAAEALMCSRFDAVWIDTRRHNSCGTVLFLALAVSQLFCESFVVPVVR